jgi:hypothetical protein
MRILQLLVEAVLYYVACVMVARKREDAPGLIRVIFVVIILAFVSGGTKAVVGDFWLSSAVLFVLSFFILWIGLGIGLFRTILAAVTVLLLRSLMEAVFSSASSHLLA